MAVSSANRVGRRDNNVIIRALVALCAFEVLDLMAQLIVLARVADVQEAATAKRTWIAAASHAGENSTSTKS